MALGIWFIEKSCVRSEVSFTFDKEAGCPPTCTIPIDIVIVLLGCSRGILSLINHHRPTQDDKRVTHLVAPHHSSPIPHSVPSDILPKRPHLHTSDETLKNAFAKHSTITDAVNYSLFLTPNPIIDMMTDPTTYSLTQRLSREVI